MLKSNKHVVPFRRKRQGKTNYRKRLELLKSGKIRLVLRRTSTSIIAQLVEYKPKGDKVICHFTSSNLEKLGWKLNPKNMPSAYLTGYAVAKKALLLGIKDAIVDIAAHKLSHNGRLFAAVKGAIDAGLNIPVGEDVLPSKDRTHGKHIQEMVNNPKQEYHFNKYKDLDISKFGNYIDEIIKKMNDKNG